MPQVSQEIDLQGWDTVNVVTLDVLNGAISAQKTWPPKFDLDETQAPGGSLGSITGDWGPWQITPGRTGGELEVLCPVVKGTGVDGFGGSHDLAGVKLRVEIALKTVNDKASNFTDKTADPKVPPPKPAQVLLVDSDSTPQNPAVVVISVTPAKFRGFSGVFQDWFNANIAAFKHIFHAAMLSETAAKGDFQWLKPTDYSYAMDTTINKKMSIFAVLCATDGDPIGGLSQQIDVNIVKNLPAGCNAVLGISGEKFCQHILLPGAVQTLHGSQAADFDIIGKDLVVTNNKDLAWRDLKLEDGTVVTPMVPANGLRMRVVEDQIEVEFTGVTFLHPIFVGNDIITISFTQYYTLNLGKSPTGEPVLVPEFPTITTSSGTVTKQIISKATISVTPDQKAQDFDRVMLIVTIAFSILPCATGLFKAGQGLWKVGTAIAAKFTQAAGTGADLALTADEAAELSSNAVQGSDNLAAAAAMSANLPADAKLATLVNRLSMCSGLILGLTGIALAVNKLDQNGDLDLGSIPAMTDFLANVLGASKWPGADNWTLQDVELAQSLLLHGKLDVK